MLGLRLFYALRCVAPEQIQLIRLRDQDTPIWVASVKPAHGIRNIKTTRTGGTLPPAPWT